MKVHVLEYQPGSSGPLHLTAGSAHFSSPLSSSQILLFCPFPPVTVKQWMIYPFESYENWFLFYSTAKVPSGFSIL